MEALKKKILTDGTAIGSEIIKVDSFLNHQIDIAFMNEIGKEFARIFSDVEVTKIVTIEASGIAIAAIASQYFNNVPVVFAKKLNPAILTLINTMERFIPLQSRGFIP